MDAILIAPDNFKKIYARHSDTEMREMGIKESSLKEALVAASGADVYFCSNFYSKKNNPAGIWIPLIQSFVMRRLNIKDEKKIRTQFVEISWKD
jgi:hypothetical protein